MVKRLAQGGEFKIVEEDFSGAIPFFEDAFRSGQRYLFVKDEGIIMSVHTISKIHIVKVIYTGDRHDTEWWYMATENGKATRLATTNTFLHTEWERLCSKLSSLNHDLIVDNNIEHKTIHVTY